MDHKAETDQLNRMTIQAVGALLGLKLPHRGTVRCPFSDHQDNRPSFEVRHSGCRWVCYGCNRNGGAIDLVSTYRGITFLESKRWLREQTGLEFSAHVGRSKEQRRVTSLKAVPKAVEAEPDHDLYARFLSAAPLQPTGQSYLTARGLSQDVMATFRVGQISLGNRVIGELIGAFGFPRVQAAGLLTKNSSPSNAHLIFPDGSVLFPFLESGRVAYFQARLIESAEDRGKWRNLNYRTRRIYNADALIDKTNKPLAICEGVIDALSAVELGLSSIGLMGINAPLSENQIKGLRGRQVSILMDWDAQGDKRAASLQDTMRKFGVAATRKVRPIPGVKDVNDYLVRRRA